MHAPAQKFRRLYFGRASAEREVADDPDRFMKTFYDRWDIRSSINKPQFCLVIGPKGIGKTAIGLFVYLSLVEVAGDHAVFAKTLNLDEVSPGVSPISSITQKLVSDQNMGLTDAAWRLFLSLRMFELVMSDASGSLARDTRIQQLASRLQASGLTGSDFPTVLRKVRENKTRVSISGFVGKDWSSKDAEEISVNHLGDALTALLLDLESENHFLLTIDGLDRIINHNDAYWQTLAALLRVADDFHNKFLQARADLRILVMCRSDVFRKIHFADSDKIAGDSAKFIDWGAHQTIAADSQLWDYVAKKAGITPEELFQILPETVTVGEREGRPQSIKIADYLLGFTRSTPRDLSLLMKKIQESIVPTDRILSWKRVRQAADSFASDNLLTIVNAEATGIIKVDVQDKLGEIVSSLPAANNVTFRDLANSVEQAGVDKDITSDLAEFLFMAGLLGNYDQKTGYIQFYHRRNTYKFRRQGPWVLQRGLMYAFNVKYGRSH
jgi:hypothetical protein